MIVLRIIHVKIVGEMLNQFFFMVFSKISNIFESLDKQFNNKSIRIITLKKIMENFIIMTCLFTYFDKKTKENMIFLLNKL